MASQEAWDFAQRLCSKRYILGGIRDGNRRAAAHHAPRRSSTARQACMCSPSSSRLFEVVAVILLIASVETSLRKRYVPKAAA